MDGKTGNMRKWKEGDRIHVGDHIVTITRAQEGDSFSGTPHYGFMWQQEDGHYQAGYMPVVMMENLGILL